MASRVDVLLRWLVVLSMGLNLLAWSAPLSAQGEPPTPEATGTVLPTDTATPPLAVSPEATASLTATTTALPSDTATPTPGVSPEATATASLTATTTALPSDTATTTPSVSPDPTATASLTATTTLTPTPTVTVPVTPTVSPPVVDFEAVSLSGSVPLTITFIHSTTHTTILEWDFGDGLTQTRVISSLLGSTELLTTPHRYTTAGVYTVSLTASGPGGSQSLTRTHYLTLSEPLQAEFSAFPLEGPAPLSVLFFNSSRGAMGYQWDFGDGLTETTVSPSHTYTQAGVYSITLLTTNGVSTQTVSKPSYLTVTATGSVVADFTAAPIHGRTPLTVTFSNHCSGAESYQWDFGDGGNSADFEPTHVYTQAGVYSITLQATGVGGNQVATRTGYLTVTQAISLAFAAFPYVAEAPALVLFLNNSSGAIAESGG